MEAAPPDSSLDAYFLLLESELRRHLNAFVAAQAQSGIVDVAGIASPDVRLVLQSLAKRWHTPQAATAAQQQAQKQYKKKNLGLEGSSVIAANFLTILTVLNCYHHRSETHWETIEQGHECALRVLRALRDKADIDTAESVRQLIVRWEALERLGDFAFDHRPKIVVVDIAQQRPFGESSTPRLVLRGLPAEATTLGVMWTLQGQDIDVDESQIHLAGEVADEADGQQKMTTAEPYVELKSIDDQQALLELGSVLIKKTPVHFVKPTESKEAVLYLRKRLPTQALLCTWENEFGQVLDEGQITWLDDEGHAVALRLTPEQYAEVEGKQITLIRTRTKIRQMQHHVKLLLPSAHMSTEIVRETVERFLAAEKAGHLTELIRIDDQLPWAVALLSSQSAKDAMIQARCFQAATAAPTEPTMETNVSGGLAHRQWFPLSPGASTDAQVGPTAAQAHITKPTPIRSTPAPVVDTPDEHAKIDAEAGEQTMQLKETVMLPYLRKQRDLLDRVEREHSVKITLALQADNKAGIVRILGCRRPESGWNAVFQCIDTVLRKATKRQSTFKFQDPLVRTFFKRAMQRFFSFSPTSAIHVVSESGVSVGPVTVHMMAAEELEIETLDRELARSRSGIVPAKWSTPLTPSAALSMSAKRLKKIEKQFNVAATLDPGTRRLRVVGYRKAVDACLVHVAGLTRAKATPSPPALTLTPSPPTNCPTRGAPAPAQRGPTNSHTDGDVVEHILRLWPRPQDIATKEIEALVQTKLCVAPTFIAEQGDSVYVRYKPPSGAPTLTAKQNILLTGDVSVYAEPFFGKLQLQKLCLQGDSTALAELPHDLLEDLLLFNVGLRQEVSKDALRMELGRIQVWHDVVTVEVGNETRLRRLQQDVHWPVGIEGVQMTLRDEVFDRTEPLADSGLVTYLHKCRDSKLIDIERSLSVSITAATTASATAREPKEHFAFVRIGGRSPDSVECAWQRVEAVIRAVVRKRCQFKFAANDELARNCFKSKLNQLHESRQCTQAIYVEEEPSFLVVHVLGDSQAEVDALDPNHVRTKLKVDRSPAPTVVTLSTATAAADASAATTSEQQVSETIEWTLAQAGPVAKLQPGLVEPKYNVRMQIDHQLSSINVSGSPPAVARAVQHIRLFMKRGAKMMAASSPVECPATTTTDAGLAVTDLDKPGEEEEAKEAEGAVATKPVLEWRPKSQRPEYGHTEARYTWTTPEGEVDASGLEKKDIELVMSHTSSRSKAVAALIKTNGDVVSAIMELYM